MSKLAASFNSDVDWPDAATRRKLRQHVLRWFAKHQRDLPWRHTRDPYAIWVSEIMLQQTQVASVIDYWTRFLERFPTVQALAKAELADVLRMWEGLGYYRRAKQLHAAAQQIVERHQARFPTDIESVRQLPGIGRYTAGAVLSIATGQSLPILEGNTIRLYSRLLGLRTDPTTTSGQKLLWHFAEQIVPRCRAGEFNQGLMELGSQVCKSSRPECSACPLKTCCVAYKNHWQHEIPAPKTRKTRWESRIECVVLLNNQDRFLGRIIPNGQRWAGMWDFCRVDLETMFSDLRISPDSPLSTEVLDGLRKNIQEQFGISCRLMPLPWRIRHGVTRFRIQLFVALGRSSKKNLTSRAVHEGWAWFSKAELQTLPLNITARKILERITIARPAEPN